ncbi:MAG: tetratricopeptide repeat protein [Candidatus Hodarchaeota archaeon]
MEKNEELIKKAKELVHQEKFEEAVDILENLYKNNPNSKQVKDSLIETLFIYGGFLNDDYTLQFKKAKELFKRIIEIDSNNYRAHYNLGIANFNLDKFEKAKECYEEAIKIKPDYKHCLYNIGLIYEREGKLEEALRYYEKALEIDPNFPYATSARSHILSNLEDLKRSKDISKQHRNIEQLKSLLDVSKRIRIEMIQGLLNIEKDKMLDVLIDWCNKYQFEIDGDYLNINKATLPDLFKVLDDEDTQI